MLHAHVLCHAGSVGGQLICVTHIRVVWQVVFLRVVASVQRPSPILGVLIGEVGEEHRPWAGGPPPNCSPDCPDALL